MKKLLCILLCAVFCSGCELKLPAPEQPPAPGQTAMPIQQVTQTTDTLNIAVCGDVEFQPHSEYNEINRHALGFVYEPLFYADGNNTILPALATGIVNNGTRVDITLRENVLWHDGSGFTAADAAYSVNLVAGDTSVYKNSVIRNAQVKNNTCITVYLSMPIAKPELLFTFPIVKNKSPQSMTKPNGTGVFSFTDKESVDTFRFTVFDKYYGANPSYTTLRMINAPDEKRVKQLYDAGETDVFSINNSMISSYTPRANTQIYNYCTNKMIYIGFNCSKIEPGLRRAIYYAFNRRDAVEKLLKQGAEFSDFPHVPTPTYPGENPFSIERAEHEMTACGYELKNGMYYKENRVCTIGFMVEDEEKYGALYDELEKKLNNFGIKCVKESREFYYERIASGEYDAILSCFEIKNCALDMFVPGNMFRYENEELRRLLSTPGADIIGAYGIIANDSPIIPIGFEKAAVSVSPSVVGASMPSYLFPYYGFSGWILN